MDKKGIIKNKKDIFVKGKILVGVLVPVILLVVLLQNVLSFRIIPTASMSGTIESGDITITNMRSYKNRNIKRLDVVLARKSGKVVQKRVIGLPGDKIAFSDGQVYINGVALEETYLKNDVYTECKKTFKVPKNSYFLLGDNRSNSSDSRNWDAPYVGKKNIIGRTYATFGLSSGIHIRLL